MKEYIIACAIGAVLIYPSSAVSASSYGGHTLETIKAMSVFCQQADKDSLATNEPETGALLKVCHASV